MNFSKANLCKLNLWCPEIYFWTNTFWVRNIFNLFWNARLWYTLNTFDNDMSDLEEDRGKGEERE